jgi:hypothetical protein
LWKSVDISDDGSVMIACAGTPDYMDYVYVYSGGTWSQVSGSTPIPDFSDWLSVAVSGDGARMAATDGLSVYVFDGGSWTEHSVGSVSDVPKALAISGDGTKLVVCGEDVQGFIYVYDFAAWASMNPFGSSVGTDWSGIAISSDGSRILVCGRSELVRYYNGSVWTSFGPLGPQSWCSVDMSDDGSVMIAARDDSTPDSIFIRRGGVWQSLETPSGSNVTSVSVTSDGVFGAAGSRAGYWFGPTNRQTTTGVTGSLNGGPYSTVELQFLGGGRFLPLNLNGDIDFR